MLAETKQQFRPQFLSWRPDTFPRHWTTNGKLKAIKQQLESHNWQGLYCTRSNSHLKNFLSNHQACFFLFSVQVDGPSPGDLVFSLCNRTKLISSSPPHTVLPREIRRALPSPWPLAGRFGQEKRRSIWVPTAGTIWIWCFKWCYFSVLPDVVGIIFSNFLSNRGSGKSQG